MMSVFIIEHLRCTALWLNILCYLSTPMVFIWTMSLTQNKDYFNIYFFEQKFLRNAIKNYFDSGCLNDQG